MYLLQSKSLQIMYEFSTMLLFQMLICLVSGTLPALCLVLVYYPD